jgi:hypothetical protein
VLAGCRVLGRENSNVHIIFSIFARILAKGTDLVENDVAKRMALLLQQMHANMRPEVAPLCMPVAMSPITIGPQELPCDCLAFIMSVHV